MLTTSVLVGRRRRRGTRRSLASSAIGMSWLLVLVLQIQMVLLTTARRRYRNENRHNMQLQHVSFFRYGPFSHVMLARYAYGRSTLSHAR